MKKTTLISFILFSCLLHAYSQQVVPFQWKEQKGIALSKKTLPLLTAKTWTTYKQYQVNKNEASAYAGSFGAFKFLSDGKFNGTLGNRSFMGIWTLEKKRILQLNIQEQSEKNQDNKIGGAYTIYKISEEELVLVKNLTSDVNKRMVYYCKGSKTNVLVESPVNTSVNTILPVDKKAQEAMQKKREQQAIINEIETEAQLRGIKLKENFEKMDAKSLQVIKNQILIGEYQKMKTKS